VESDVRARAVTLEQSLRRRNVRQYAASALVVVGCAAVAVVSDGTWLLRLACAVGAFSAATISARVWRAGWRAQPTHEGASDETRRATLERALSRERDLQASAWRWYVAPFAATASLFLVSAAAELYVPLPRVAAAAALTVVVSAAAALAGRRAARRLQRELDALVTGGR
jgi:hypothetical protein